MLVTRPCLARLCHLPPRADAATALLVLLLLFILLPLLLVLVLRPLLIVGPPSLVILLPFLFLQHLVGMSSHHYHYHNLRLVMVDPLLSHLRNPHHHNSYSNQIHKQQQVKPY